MYLRITENCRGREKGMKKTELLGGGGDGKAAQIARVVQMVREFLAERPDRGGRGVPSQRLLCGVNRRMGRLWIETLVNVAGNS